MIQDLLIDIIYATINSKQIDLSKNDKNLLINELKEQNLSSFLYYATHDNDYFKYYYLSMSANLKTDKLLQDVFAAFSTNSIKYITFKGFNLKNLYPDPALRVMGDVDILVDTNNFENAINVLEDLGYKRGHQCFHHIELTKDNQLIEIHSSMFDTDQVGYQYFIDPFSHAHQIENNSFSYILCDEYYFSYILTHHAKHVMLGGSGLRDVIDLYLMLEKMNINIENVRNSLKEIGLDKFLDTTLLTINYIFKTNYTTVFNGDVGTYLSFLIKSGVHGFKKGNDHLQNTVNASKDSKISYVFKRVFIPKSSLRIQYNNYKTPIFFLYIKRIFILLFTRKKKGITVLKTKKDDTFSKIGL